MQTVLHRKIGHLHPGPAVGILLKPGFFPQVLGKFFIDHFQVSHKTFVGLERLQGGLLKDAEHFDRIVAGGLPQVLIKPAKQIDGIRFPAPPEVVGNALQGGQFIGQ